MNLVFIVPHLFPAGRQLPNDRLRNALNYVVYTHIACRRNLLEVHEFPSNA